MSAVDDSLQRWLSRLLSVKWDNLVQRYSTGNRDEDETCFAMNHSAREDVESLRLEGLSSAVSGIRNARLPDELLMRLHQKLRGASCEGSIWDVVIGELSHPIPDEVAHDLIDRQVAIDMLGHSRQNDNVQWRLASFYPEALLTLGIELFTQDQYSPSEFQTLLETLVPDHEGAEWLLSTLARHDASTPQKEEAYLEALGRYSESTELQRIRRVRPLELRARDTALSLEEIEELYATREPEVLLALAANPNTPASIL